MRSLIFALSFVVLSAVATAQTASFTSYTQPCPSNTTPLSIQGVPQMGGSFTVQGIAFPSFCTRRFCGCNVGPCNTCAGSALVIGVAKARIPLPGGCTLDLTPDILVTPSFPGNVTVNVPSNAAIRGFRFYMQRMDLALSEQITASCGKAYVPTGFRGFSNAVEGVVGS